MTTPHRATRTSSFLRPRTIFLGFLLIIVLVIGSYAYSLAEMAGYLPWQAEPTAIANDITPFAGTGFESLPTTPAKATSVATEGVIAIATP
jgi:hypothetical protein